VSRAFPLPWLMGKGKTCRGAAIPVTRTILLTELSFCGVASLVWRRRGDPLPGLLVTRRGVGMPQVRGGQGEAPYV